MLFLRWLVGISCAVALTFFALVLLVGKGIRSTYQSGAGVVDVVRDTAVYAVPVLLAAMLVSVFLPAARTFLHVVAFGVVLAVIGCVSILTESPREGALYIAFFVLWLLYYVTAVWMKA